MEKLYEKVREFQKTIPAHGSPEMIVLMNEIISEYDTIKEVKLFEGDGQRRFQLSMLSSVANIKERFLAGEDLSRSLFLYGLSPFDRY